MAAITFPLEGSSMKIIPTSSIPTQRYVYANGARTDQPVLRNGKPVYTFDAAMALEDNVLGTGRVESTTSELPNVSFGGVLEGSGLAELRISPRDAFSLRLTLAVDEVVAPHKAVVNDITD